MPTDPTMTDYAGNPDNWPETYRLLSDATRGYADRIDQALEALGDRTATDRARALGKPLWLPLFSGVTTSVAYPVNRFTATMGLAGPPPSFRAGWQQTDVTTTGAILWTTKVPVGSYLHGIVAYVKCEPATVLSLPTTMPRVRLHRQPTDGSDNSLIAEVIDSSPTFTAFNAYHPISFIWGTATVLDDDDLVVVEYRGMQGGGAVNGALKLVAIKLVLDTQQTIVVP